MCARIKSRSRFGEPTPSTRPAWFVRAGLILALADRHADPIPNRPAWAILLSLAVLVGCSPSSKNEAVPAAFAREGDQITVPSSSPLRGKLRIEAARLDAVAPLVIAPALVETDPRRTARITAPYAGRITRLDVQLGDRVRAGQALAVLAAPDAGVVFADLRKASAQLVVATAQRTRAHQLQAIGGIADKDVQQAEADYLAAIAERDRAAGTARTFGVGTDGQVVIRAPSAGSITELAAAPGALAPDTTSPLMTVADLNTVWVTANVAEGDIARVRVGQTVAIRLAGSPQDVIDGRVAAIADVLDPETRRAKVRIVVANPDHRLKPGMFANVEISAIAAQAVTAPPAALLLRDDRTRVFVEERPFVFRPRVVVTGDTVGGRVVVVQGLRPGERIVSAGGVFLND